MPTRPLTCKHVTLTADTFKWLDNRKQIGNKQQVRFDNSLLSLLLFKVTSVLPKPFEAEILRTK